MRILLDADTLLEFLLNRSKFIGKVEYLAEIFGANSSIQLYLSKPGLDKIVSLQALNEKESEQLVTRLKKRIKILRVTKAVAKKAKSSSAIDYESAVEIHLAIKANIGAIVTHKPSDFSFEELSIITLNDLQQRKHLEDNLSKNIKDLPAVFVINSEQISNLDKAFYHLPSYTGVKSLEPKESSHQLDLTCSSDKVSSPSGDNSSPRSKRFQAIEQIILDSLSIKSSAFQPIAQLEPPKFGSLATTLQSFKNPLDESMNGILQVGKAHSSAVDSLSIKSPISQPIAQLEPPKFGSLATTLQSFKNPLDESMNGILQVGKAYSSAVDSLSIKSPISQPIAQLEPPRLGSLATTLQSFKNPSLEAYSSAYSGLSTTLQALNNSVSGISKVMRQVEKASFMTDAFSLKSPILKSIAQLDAVRFSGLATERLTCTSSLDTLKERIDRSGLLSQIKSIESMQRTNTLDSYLSRKS
jgi:hypothetical protein